MGTNVRDVMTARPRCVAPETPLSQVAELRRLPVVDEENRLVGVISQADVALEAKDKAVGEMLAEVSKPPEGPRQTR
jgi:CBS-domain-containing membrane protein